MSLNQLLIAKAAGLTTLNQVEIVLCLATTGTMPMNRMAKRLGITTAAITGLMDRLTGLELIQRHFQQGDRRIVLASLSGKGSTLARQLGLNPSPLPA
jgi:DNA-binding MarR family transcriptional regulator